MKTKKTTFQLAGLSDRRKTCHLSRIHCGSILTALLIAGVACTSCQDNKLTAAAQKRPANATAFSLDKSVKPKMDAVVNLRYDRPGNLVAFDSSYTTLYAPVPDDTVHMRLMNPFTPHFHGSQTPWFHRGDSMRQPDLFHDLYFQDIRRRRDATGNPRRLKLRTPASPRKENA